MTVALIVVTLLIVGCVIVWRIEILPDKVRPKPPQDIVTRKCRCYRDYSYHVNDKDPGECPQCRIRKS